VCLDKDVEEVKREENGDLQSSLPFCLLLFHQTVGVIAHAEHTLRRLCLPIHSRQEHSLHFTLFKYSTQRYAEASGVPLQRADNFTRKRALTSPHPANTQPLSLILLEAPVCPTNIALPIPQPTNPQPTSLLSPGTPFVAK
ncbi:hypothetical protein BT69DRAFT_1275912, partial [Atractiella rhizophila]